MAAKDWLDITDRTLAAVDGLTDEQMAVMRRSLDQSFNQISKDMLGTYRRLEGADPQYIQVELAKLKKANIARQILSPDKADQFEAIMQTLLEEQTANGIKYSDLMTAALSNPPELVQQFGNINIEAVAAIAKDGRKRLQKHSEDAAKKIIDAVANNLLQGGSMAKLTSTISGQLGLVKHRAENIARTSTMTAFNQASQKRYKGYGVEYVQIIALVDRRTTPWCRWRHMKIVAIASSMPPYHFQCLVGDTNVLPCGKITSISARPYRGKVVRITTATGNSLTITPNHPVMTSQGFVAAKLLNCGDQVVRHLSGQRFSPTETDKDHMVSSIEEAFQSFLRSGEMLPVPVPLTPMNFHGDVTDNDIGVVLVNRHLSDGEIARIAQQFVHCYLKSTAPNVSSSESRRGDFSEFVTRLFDPPNSLVCSFNEGKLAFCRKIIHSGLLLLRSIADMNPPAFKNPLDDVASNPEVFGDRLIPFAPMVGGDDLGDLPIGESMDLDVPARLPSLGESSGNGIGTDPHLASDFLQAKPFISELDRIVNVEVLDFCGHVYNPSTETGVYVSNSIVSHNCRTTTAPVDPAWLSDDDLKWMQDEMAAAKKTGLVNMNRAPFDEKKPTFYTPSKFKNNIAPFKPKKQAIATPKSADGFPTDPMALKIIKTLGGSTGAELVQDPISGKQYVRKLGANAAHIKEEFYADQAYAALGVPVPKGKLYETGNAPIKLTEYIEGKPLSDFSGKELVKIHKQLQKGFAADALLGNWDVVGLSKDNILVGKDGIAYRIDNGGSLRYRAQGGKKGDAWNDYPTELFSLRDKKSNAQTAEVFGGMSHDEVMKQVRAIAKNQKALSAALPVEIRRDVEARLKEAERTAKISKTLRDDKFNEDYTDKFVKHSLGVRAFGLVDKLPKQFDLAKNNQLYDEKGVRFDGLRSEGEIVQSLEKYIKDSGGDYRQLSSWMRGQAGSSWSDNSQALKYLVAQSRGNSDSYFWLEDTAIAKGYYEAEKSLFKNYDDTAIAFHAWNYELFQRVKMPNNDTEKGYFTMYRTEGKEIISGIAGLNVGDKDVTMLRGAVESGSAFSPINAVAGGELTIQRVPHHRIMGNYFQSRSSTYFEDAFLGDRENEITFIPEGIPFDYVSSGSLNKYSAKTTITDKKAIAKAVENSKSSSSSTTKTVVTPLTLKQKTEVIQKLGALPNFPDIVLQYGGFDGVLASIEEVNAKYLNNK